MKTLQILIISAFIGITISILMQFPFASSESGSLTGFDARSPDLSNMSLVLYDKFDQVSPNSTKDLYLEFFDEKNKTLVKNVSFFVNATKDDTVLIRELFYTHTGFMTLKFSPGSDTGKWVINGTAEPVLGGMMSDNDVLPIEMSAFTSGTYHFHIEVLALVYTNGIADQTHPPTFDSWWSVDDKGNISKYANSTTVSKIKNASPLQQFKSGVAADDVKCGQGLQFVIKTKDGSPACVKPQTKAKLVERGWTRSILSLNSNLDKESKITSNDTYLSQTVDEWKNKTHEQLNVYYEKYKDKFYTDLGSFLIKDEMKKELTRQKIQNIHDDFKVFPGMSLDSLPPHISYDAVVNATDGNSYLLLGGVFANKIESSPKIIKLVFDKNALHSISTGNGPSYPDPSANTHVDNSTSQEKVQIAGTYIEDSDIPWSSVGTGNYGVIQIGLYTSVYHMIPDAQKYYTARAMQLIPFYVPVKILPPPSIAK